MIPVVGHPSSGVVTATGPIVSPEWVGAMNWFMMTSTSASFHVGRLVKPMIKAHLVVVVPAHPDRRNQAHGR
jgi:hypothetical protein